MTFLLILAAIFVVKCAVVWFTREDSVTKSVNFSMIPLRAEKKAEQPVKQEEKLRKPESLLEPKAYPEAV